MLALRQEEAGDVPTRSEPHLHVVHVPPDVPSVPVLTTMPRHAPLWALWMGLIVAGFLWQFVAQAAGYLNQ